MPNRADHTSRFTASLAVLLAGLYVSQGLPSGFFAHALPTLLREQGVSLTWIGMLKLLAMPWFFKFLWAPLVDRYGFTRLGHYRSWIIALQLIAATLLLLLAWEYPTAPHPPAAVLFGFAALVLLINTTLATQDIATDALAVRLLPAPLRGLGNGIQVSGYKIGMLAGGNGLLIAAGSIGWPQGFRDLAVLILLLMLPLLFFREPVTEDDRRATQPLAHESSQHESTVHWQHWRDWLQQPAMSLWLPVLLCYKIADALASGMIKPLLVDSGFSVARIGKLGLLSSFAGIVAALAGGLFTRWLGQWPALLLAGLLQSAGLALWALVPLHVVGEQAVYAIAVFEQVADGLSTVALFTAMMGYCRSSHAGSDYTAQMSLFMLVSGTLSLGGGWLAQQFGAAGFFVTSALVGVCCLWPVLRAWRTA